MDNLKQSFIRLALDCKVLQFGQFTLKSKRISPYFFNAGLFYQGPALRQVGQFYAKCILKEKLSFDHLFGPAYKGLPLATATAIGLAELGCPSTVTFNRKEIKDHGEGGQLIGAPLSGKTLIIDDVITAGTAFREVTPLIQQAGGTIMGIVLAFDRCERGLTGESAVQAIETQGIKVYSLINFFDLLDYLRLENKTEEVKALSFYHQQYGVSPST